MRYEKEVAADRVEIKIDINAVFAPARYVLYLMDNCSGSAVRNRHLKLGKEENKQLAALMRSFATHVVVALSLQDSH